MEPWRQCKESLSRHMYARHSAGPGLTVLQETGLMTAGHCLHTDDTVMTSLYRLTQDYALTHLIFTPHLHFTPKYIQTYETPWPHGVRFLSYSAYVCPM